MAVYKALRGESDMQFVETARQLAQSYGTGPQLLAGKQDGCLLSQALWLSSV